MRESDEESKFAQLRMLAEKMLHEQDNFIAKQPDNEHIKQLIHELHVHQIELEIQNEELMRSRMEAEQSRNEYALLYESAPIGYFTLDQYGIILKANHMGSLLSGRRLSSLIKKPFRSLLTFDSGKTFYTFIQQVFETTEKQFCEVGLTHKTGKVSEVRLEGWQIKDTNNTVQCLLGVIDLTERKSMERETMQLKLTQQQELMNAILNAQEQERIRIGESLHNGLAQVLYAAKLNLQVLHSLLDTSKQKEVAKALNTVDNFLVEGIELTRSISHDLVPTVIKDFGLEYALNAVCSKVSSPDLTVTLDYRGFNQRLEQNLEMAIFRIVQELINNILKHSRARMALVKITRNGTDIFIQVKDNGIGFEVEREMANGKGIGLSSIQNRVVLLSGTVNVHSQPNQGTQISILLPEKSIKKVTVS
ncbi:PAS domain-containing sensor histidine kinase [Xanthocytophaga flava]|uniref:PAS domain-containing sensor histidine kinase n=1 Tax=Xanthocytophaga flava TaxID=3048013 RepID=UPI0028D4E8CD|nr:ATP-binding protein [Xanthocytophaga flavus]MDJ1470778.1 PAS domain S-box protein [Xanthocytophaga flavus]